MTPFAFDSHWKGCCNDGGDWRRRMASSSSYTSSAYQQYIDQLGSYAKSSTPAYTLSALFALSAPFAFPGGRDQQRVPTPSHTSPVGKLLGSNLKSAVPLRSALPPFWQLAGFAAFFGGGGYMIDKGDSLNGSGTITGTFQQVISSLCLPSTQSHLPT